MEVKFRLDGIEFDTLDEMVRIMKYDEDFNYKRYKTWFLVKETPGFLDEDESKLVEGEEFNRMSEEDFDKIERFQGKELFTRYSGNQEQFMLIMSVVSNSRYFDEVLDQIGYEVIDRQEIKKERIFTKHKDNLTNEQIKDLTLKGELNPEDFISETKDYTEVLELIQFEGKKVGLDEDVQTVKCSCTSTGKVYYLTVEPKYKDVLKAMASIHHKVDEDGFTTPFSEEEYINLMNKES